MTQPLQPGSTGASLMIETIQAIVPKGSVALIDEPSRMKMITGNNSPNRPGPSL